MKRLKICFICANPHLEGGVSNYQKNLIKYLQLENKNLDISWIYKSIKDERYIKEKINYIGLGSGKITFISDFVFNKKVNKYLNKNYFDIINSHALYGYWMNNYKKPENQILIHTYHGAGFPYYKIHLKKFGLIKRALLSPLLYYAYLIEKPPIKKADKIICVSEKVKKQIKEVYGNRKDIFAIRTGVDLTKFKLRNKNLIRKILNLDKDNIYGLHVAKGGYWIKGLDRVVELSKEIYKRNKNYRLIVIGQNYEKNKSFLNNKFVISLEKIPLENIPVYYSASDMFFCLSRYEGGAPTLVVSEAMASGCLVVCSRDAEQEIIENNKNGIIIEQFNEKESEKISSILKDKKKMKEIINNSIKTVKEFSLKKWGEKYLKILIR